LGLDGFLVLEVFEGPGELVIDVETVLDFVGCEGVRPACRGPGSDTGRDPGSGVLRSSGAAGVAEAPVALRRR
jgi:hypothetical protein